MRGTKALNRAEMAADRRPNLTILLINDMMDRNMAQESELQDLEFPTIDDRRRYAGSGGMEGGGGRSSVEDPGRGVTFVNRTSSDVDSFASKSQ